MRKIRVLLSFMIASIFVVACSHEEVQLKKSKGFGTVHSEYFKAYEGLNEQEKTIYYKPVSIDQLPDALPIAVKQKLKIIEQGHLPFTVDEKLAYVTKFKHDGVMKHAVQLSYIKKNEYDSIDQFFNISITESDKNPLLNYQYTETKDSVGNELKQVTLTDDTFIYQQIITTDGGLLYTYYDEIDGEISAVGTQANELYAYHKGYIYHFGYSVSPEVNDEQLHDDLLALAKAFILADA